ncbi:TPA: GNAT family N-acetyltransferase [Listeria monocytogenes]|uniref:Acetyltransferase n=1 Tax=Listeria monocytogenes TaxID=1639 RepID=A0AB37NQX2_LISMN|nr:GNAT family N-acetyltransferase [Listeria monocytogenes]EAF4462552.1 GNAT family N-acetyltransferase [Listeria monocytogenes serotype 1/2a]EAF4572302.1 GNAT family N-acetyltransferase [Listeria monocytogenes serotype 4b]AGR09222.1 GNAT family acetyltransferase [Listeria monocytogenes]ALU76704.1 GNAT family acetyltransferase [Listeria monocytogenes]ARJ86374.1 N-acetyltransferase [Listeria monocytogenes]
MTVKKVTDDIGKQAALKIRNDVFVVEQRVDPTLEWDEFDEIDSVVMFVDYAEDGTPLATGRFREKDGYGKVERICTQKVARGTGSGRRIMEAIESEAKSRGLTTLKLGAQVTAIPFYEKLGYETCSGLYLDAGIEHKDMKKTLTYEI